VANGPSIGDPVDIVELRIERRREQLRRDWDEARAYVARKSRWAPLAAVAGVAALGFGLARLRRTSLPATARVVAKPGALAAIAAMLGGAVRFALTPAGRALWSSWNRGRGGPR
jgi:hypothetical protein